MTNSLQSGEFTAECKFSHSSHAANKPLPDAFLDQFTFVVQRLVRSKGLMEINDRPACTQNAKDVNTSCSPVP